MDSSSQEKSSYDHSGDEEALPLYSSSQDATKPPIPEKTATPAEVREFVTQLLVVTRALRETDARDISTKWTLGSGEDLMDNYPPQMFREIFGSEEGWLVCKEVMLHKYETVHPEANQRKHGCMGLAFTSMIMVAMVLLGRFALAKDASLTLTFAIIIGLFDGIAMVATFIMAVSPKTPASELVDRKLKDSFFKVPQSSN